MADFTAAQNLLSMDEVLGAYRTMGQCYPHHPSVALWRAWEYAAYRHHALNEPALDLGCGDGQFFRLVWPHVEDVVGLDVNPAVAEAARKSGVYREVHVIPAYELPFESDRFASIFANCSLEHMDQLPAVLRHVVRCLRPGGKFLFSVVTDKFLEWTTLPLLLRITGVPERGRLLQSEYIQYHHLLCPFSPEAWANQLTQVGFIIEDYIPIVPELTARFFLFLDHVWHIPFQGSEVGESLLPLFGAWPGFSSGIEDILRGFLRMESNWATCAGAVFYAQKPPRRG